MPCDVALVAVQCPCKFGKQCVMAERYGLELLIFIPLLDNLSAIGNIGLEKEQYLLERIILQKRMILRARKALYI